MSHNRNRNTQYYLSFYERIGRPFVLTAEGYSTSEDTLSIGLTEAQREAVENILEARPVIAVADYSGNPQRGTYQYKGYGELRGNTLLVHIRETFRQQYAS